MTIANSLWHSPPSYRGGGALAGDALATEQAKKALWDDAAHELLALMRLGENWDGQGSKPPTLAISITASHVFRGLRDGGSPPPSSITVSPNGAIVMTWETVTSYREAEIAEPNRISWMLERDGRPTRHWEEDFRGR